MKYPTKKQILELPRPTYPRGIMLLVSEWKTMFYKDWEINTNKITHLTILANIIAHRMGKTQIFVFNNTKDYYSGDIPAIWLKEPYSVLSLLHELAHHLFGEDELTACRWSVWLYQLRFRKDYEKLIWQEHMLVKPSSPTKTKK